MNIIRSLLILICLCSNYPGYTQSLGVGLQTGIGFYNMEELRAFNAEVFGTLPFKAKIISDYPPYFYYKPSCLISFGKITTGFKATYYSSGSRISSRDISGEYLLDTRINSIAPGLYIDLHLFSISKYKIWLFNEGGFLFSKLRMKENLTVDGQELIHSSYNFKSENYFIEPGLKVDYNIYHFISIEINTSYFTQFGKNIFETNQGEIIDYGQGPVHPDWNGFRFGLSLLIKAPLLKIV
jgi:hypothetical protein